MEQNSVRKLVSYATALTLLGSPLTVSALGLGRLVVSSPIDTPLVAEIELTAIGSADLGTVEVALASRQDFDNATIERSQILQRLQFTVDRRADSTPIIRVTSDQAISEPFLQFLVTVQWPGGKLIREYTALLDPPLYAGAQNANTVQSPSATTTENVDSVTTDNVESEAIQIVEQADIGVGEQADQVAPADLGTTTGQVIDTGPIESADVVVTGALDSAVYAGSQITTRAGDTLTEIASTIPIPSNVNLYQAMIAIQEANPSAFIDGNMNRLKRDVELTIPDLSTGVVSRDQARQIFSEQVREFERYRQGVASSVPRQVAETPAEPTAEPSQPTAATDDAATETADVTQAAEDAQGTEETQTPVATAETPETAEEGAATTTPNETVTTDGRLKISQAETDVDASEREKILGDLSQAEEQVFALDAENKELRERLALLESKVEQSTRLAQIEQTRLAELEAQARATAKEREEAQLREEAEAERLRREQIAAERRAEEQRLAAELAQQELNEQQRIADESEQTAVVTTPPVQQPTAVQPQTPVDTGVQPQVETAETGTNQQGQAQQEPAESASFLDTAKEKLDQVVSGDGDSQPGIGAKIAASFSSFTDTVRSFLAGSWAMMGAFGLIVLGLVGLIIWRRRRSIAEFEESILSGSALDIQTDTAETGTASTAATDTSFLSEFGVPGMGGMQTDEVDPIAEAEVYMAYGRDEQAEEVLKEAINRDSRPELKLKLLEIYRSRNEVKEFETLAEELYPAHGNEPDEIWRKVVEMGQQLSPDNPLFKGGVVAASAAAVGAAMASGGSTNAYSPSQQPDAVPAASAASVRESVTASDAFPKPQMDPSVDAELDQLTQQAELANPSLEAFQVNDIERAAETDEINLDIGDSDNGVDFEPSDSSAQTVAQDVLNLDVSPSDSTRSLEEVAKSADTIEFDLDDDSKGVGAGLAAAGAAAVGVGSTIAGGVTDTLADAGEAVAGSKEKVRQVFESSASEFDDELSLSSLDDADSDDTIELDNSPASDDAEDALSLDIDGLSFDSDDEHTLSLSEDDDEASIFGVAGADGDSDNATKLDLAKAYRDMGDEVGARGFLEEVIQNGSAQQKQEAAELMAQIESA